MVAHVLEVVAGTLNRLENRVHPVLETVKKIPEPARSELRNWADRELSIGTKCRH